MQVDLNRKLIDFRGNTILDQDGSPMTLRKAASFALVATLAGDERASLDDKLNRETLAARLWQGEVLELTVEQAALVKSRINATFPSPLLVGAAVRALEGQPDWPVVEDGGGRVVQLHPGGDA